MTQSCVRVCGPDGSSSIKIKVRVMILQFILSFRDSCPINHSNTKPPGLLHCVPMNYYILHLLIVRCTHPQQCTPLSHTSYHQNLSCNHCQCAFEDLSSVRCCYLCSHDFCSACIAVTSGKFADSPHPSEEQICMNCYDRNERTIIDVVTCIHR